VTAAGDAPRPLADVCAEIERLVAAKVVTDEELRPAIPGRLREPETSDVHSCLFLLAAAERPRRVLELPAGMGRRTIALVAGAAEALERLVAVEPEGRWRELARETLARLAARLRIAPALDLVPALALAADDVFDLVVVGDAHAERVPALWPRVREGGLVLCDDVADDEAFALRAALDAPDFRFWDFPTGEAARPWALLRKGKAGRPAGRSVARPRAPHPDGTGLRVSFVVGSRNDDHGGNPRRRMELFVHGLAAVARRRRLRAELVVVDWNPPPDRPPLAEALSWPADPGPLDIRVVTVPPALHARIANADKLRFFQMIAKNVGIRRARGAFVVATNMDVLFSEALVEFLAGGPLDPGCVYRVNRLDVGLRDLPPGLDVEEQLALCSLNVARVCEVRGTVARPPAELRRRYGHAAAPWRGFAPGALERIVADAERRRPVYEACGDFTMLAREAWAQLRAYPELGTYSLHLDSVFLKTATVAGLRQVVLPDPMRMYHIEHGMGWGVAEDRARLRRDYPMLTDADLAAWLARLDEAGAPLTTNDERWGFADEALPEWRWEPAR